MNRVERLALVEREHAELALNVQAELLGLSRASLYYRPVPPSAEEIAIKHRIDEIYTRYPFYGSRRITAQLCREEILINRKAVQRHMQQMGIAGICPGPNLSKRNAAHRVYPYLLRQITAAYPNHIWGIDITYIRLAAGWMYLVAILDWFSRYVIAWELDQTLEIAFVLGPWRRRSLLSGTATRAATSRVPNTSSVWSLGMSRSAWMGRVERWTTSSPKGSGAP